MKQLVPTSIEEYIAEHKLGDVVTGRVIEVAGEHLRVELGEGLQASCRVAPAVQAKSKEESQSSSKADLSSLSSILQARWKGGDCTATPKPEAIRAGQVRSFRITQLDQTARKIELELA